MFDVKGIGSALLDFIVDLSNWICQGEFFHNCMPCFNRFYYPASIGVLGFLLHGFFNGEFFVDCLLWFCYAIGFLLMMFGTSVLRNDCQYYFLLIVSLTFSNDKRFLLY